MTHAAIVTILVISATLHNEPPEWACTAYQAHTEHVLNLTGVNAFEACEDDYETPECQLFIDACAGIWPNHWRGRLDSQIPDLN